jgi:hypothetical protein
MNPAILALSAYGTIEAFAADQPWQSYVAEF